MADLNLYADISGVVSRLSPDGAVKALINYIMNGTDSLGVFVFTLQEKNDAMVPFICLNKENIQAEIPVHHNLLHSCFEMFIKSRDNSERQCFELIGESEEKDDFSFFGKPIILAGKPIALLALVRKCDAPVITEHQEEFTNTLLPVIGSLLENIRLENEMIHKNSRLSTLYDISQQTESVIDLRDIYSALSKIAKSFINFDVYRLYFLSDDKTKLESKNLDTDPNSKLLPISVAVGEGPIGLAAKTGEPQLSYLGEFNSVLTLPITVSDKLIGVFAIGSRKSYAYRSEDIIGLRIIASHIASIDSMFKDLLNLKGFTERIMDSMKSGVLIFDRSGAVSYVNPEMRLMMHKNVFEGWSSCSDSEMLPSSLKNIVSEAIHTNLSIESRKIELPLKDGMKKIFEVDAFPVRNDNSDVILGVACFVKDITRTLEIEEQLRRADKLSAIGMLAAGVAHEIRNPLTGMKMITQLLESDYGEDDERREPLKIIQKEINRLDGIVGGLLGFARPAKSRITDVDICDVIKDCYALVYNQLKKQNIAYSETIEAPCALVKADVDQIKQVFINIITNAIQAQTEGGSIAVKVYCKDKWLVTEFKDSGTGIPKNKLKDIFNPFMTTKDDGTGLGLPMALRIVEEHKGYIEVKSEPGSGTSFLVFFPLENLDDRIKDKENQNCM